MNKHVGIKTGLADKYQHRAGMRFDSNDRSSKFTQAFFSNFLQLNIQIQGQIIAGDGCHFFQNTQYPPLRIHLNFLPTDSTVQLCFVVFFQSSLADVRGTTVITFINHR